MAQDVHSTVATAAQLACLLEATAEKPGNVTPTHPFADMSYEDFLRSAVAIGPEMARAGERDVGQTILAAVEATRRWTQANTNLGIILLLAPLAKAALNSDAAAWQSGELRSAVGEVLRGLTVADAEASYQAIRLAEPGGFEEAVEHDIHHRPTVTLREAMAGAVERDSIAAEYLSDYAITFERGLPALERALVSGAPLSEVIVQVYLELLADVPDTLIARKNGRETALAVSQDAAEVLSRGGIFSRQGRQAMLEFDQKLRKNQNELNPGTTADLVSAILFVALLEGKIE
jgi:triphosphoribosyl-dephospho-CoA synthase